MVYGQRGKPIGLADLYKPRTSSSLQAEGELRLRNLN